MQWEHRSEISSAVAFLLIPIPEPMTQSMLAKGAMAGLGRKNGRKRFQAMATIVAIAVMLLTAGTVQATDVFNMGSGLTSLTMVTVGDPGNAVDKTGYGAVSYTYQMGKYDVTAAQYCQFLNAVATQSDTYGLYNTYMAGGPGTCSCGITRTGSPGSYSYNTTSSGYSSVNNGNFPVNYVTWGDAARFCNWVTNGQPTVGVENLTTTENGSYYVNGATTDAALMGVTRNANAQYVIPTEDEWYKPAYYKGGGTNAGYWLYPTKSNTNPSNTLSSTGTNNANFYNPSSLFSDPVNYLTVVGAFAGSPGPYGTYDMGGDVYQWDETGGSDRHLAGGDFYIYGGYMQAGGWVGANPSMEVDTFGFRVADVGAPVPEPLTMLALSMGIVGLGGYIRRRRVAAK
jgi:formylglycine-generating enzyme required for sulfatase activity